VKKILPLALISLLAACATQPATTNNNQSATATNNSPATTPPSTQPASTPSPVALNSLKVGEASGSIVVGSETIPLKYAYATTGEMFEEPAVVVMVSETEITNEALNKALASSFSVFFPSDNKGLEYKVGKGFWVMYHPGSFQTSGINTFKEYSVENGIVRGHDEDTTNFDGKDYKRSVSFVAKIIEKKK
jgi:hypothetical protein